MLSAEQVIAKHGPQITEAALTDMPYLGATLKENLRLHPVIQAVPRRALANLEVDGYYVPKVFGLSTRPDAEELASALLAIMSLQCLLLV